MNFPTSTHKSRWLLSPEDLEARRCARYDKSVREIERYRPASTSAAASVAPGEGGEKAPQQLGGLELVSMEEEKQLFSYYERMISKICVLYNFSRKILAISIVYFKRFYLKFSILDYEPWTLMITCVYLACKVENAYISAEELAKGVQQDARIVEKIVLGSEMNLLQGLDFDLVVHTPYAALDGFCFDLETYVQEKLPAGECWELERAEAFAQRLRKKGYESIDALLFSDGPLLHAPGLLAFAALEVALKASGEKALLREYVASLLARADGGMAADQLAQAIQAIHKLGQSGASGLIDESTLKQIDRKLKLCRNPVYDPSSEQYKKQQAEKQRQKQRAKANLKRSSVAQDAQALGMTKDLFIAENPDSKRRKSKESHEETLT
mmetsp:Transcript_13150/g.27763  ORF Transcript_13150/g.27763 Transcript_13150/m.27763 type:complete len:382 (+) Transcript_13150:189-1334(+)